MARSATKPSTGRTMATTKTGVDKDPLSTGEAVVPAYIEQKVNGHNTLTSYVLVEMVLEDKRGHD